MHRNENIDLTLIFLIKLSQDFFIRRKRKEHFLFSFLLQKPSGRSSCLELSIRLKSSGNFSSTEKYCEPNVRLQQV